MFIQIALGSILLLASIAIAGVSFWIMEVNLQRFRPYLMKEPHRPKLILMLCIAAVWILAQITISVWMWAIVFKAIGAFPTMEESMYFAIVSYTTLGLGDVVLDRDWRILSGMAAANGLLNIGLLTALLVEALRQVRAAQFDAIRGHRGI